jgi:integrase
MPFITKKINNLSLNYEKHFGLKRNEEFFEINPGQTIKEITILLNEKLYSPVEEVNAYLIHRTLLGINNSGFEVRGLRLYYDFLEGMELNWDGGSDYIHQRPIAMFGKWLKESFESGSISGTTASAYFDSVARFYKFHLSNGYPFEKPPISFTQKIVKKFSSSLINHINHYEIELDIADYKPNIPSQSKSSELKPFKEDDYKLLFDTLKSKSSKDFMLICMLSASTGLRASEVAALRLDMITSHNGEDVFDLYVGPQVGHKTKGNKNGIIKVSGKIIKLLNKHIKSKEYIKRLAKFKGDNPTVFITQRGNPFSQQVISAMFSGIVTDEIKSKNKDFNYKFHDLRTTFGVNTMKSCLNSEMNKEESMSYTQNQMRHKSLKTTMKYLEFWTQASI